ncbi:chemotaxis protein CheX [Bacillus infantis]|uniref:chemotaxis protein CheX n=1 Tax=Bacillus infantis TaxID=324767 RepID=UPI00101C6E78|nr:chemotaxis protein CheX [Bacillus infantis]RYI31202.1 chemotaxis protein CheX [Bacillus infantis]
MSLTKNVGDIISGTIESIKSVFPFESSVEEPAQFSQPFTQHSIGVLIGMTGDLRGRVIIDGEEQSFSKIGEAMFGMLLEGEMLESFAGELGNMIAGNLSINLSGQGLQIDITPPTVLVGETKVYGFEKAYSLPVKISGAGELMVVLMLE